MRRIVLQTMAFVAMASTIALCSVPAAWAQTTPAKSNNLSGTITVTGTFQTIQGQANNRIGCAIQNITPSDTQWVYFGACANATKAASASLQPGQTVSCNLPGSPIVLSDPVCITGTSGDSFFANFQ